MYSARIGVTAPCKVVPRLNCSTRCPLKSIPRNIRGASLSAFSLASLASRSGRTANSRICLVSGKSSSRSKIRPQAESLSDSRYSNFSISPASERTLRYVLKKVILIFSLWTTFLSFLIQAPRSSRVLMLRYTQRSSSFPSYSHESVTVT